MKMVSKVLLVLISAAMPISSIADEGCIAGRWRGTVGEIDVKVTGDDFEGRLKKKSPICPFESSEPVLRGGFSGGSFAGELRFCLEECAETDGDVWGFAMLVLDGNRLAGAVHAPSGSCTIKGVGERGAVVLERVVDEVKNQEGGLPVGLEVDIGTYDPRRRSDPRELALNEARLGAALLEQGRFESARSHFLKAVEIDEDYAEGYNGIGVTHALRRDWNEAIRWYRRSISVGPHIGDAYYNLACALAQTDEHAMALSYLRLAILNGYTAVDHFKEDPDLQPLHEHNDYKSLLDLGGQGSED